MTILAQRLPVASIPEQDGITPVGDDMVDNGCGSQLAIFSAFHAKRILFEKQCPGRAPFTVISTGCSALPGINRAMFLAEYALR